MPGTDSNPDIKPVEFHMYRTNIKHSYERVAPLIDGALPLSRIAIHGRSFQIQIFGY